MASRTVNPAQDKRLRLRDQGICVYCREAVGAVFDHVLPWKHGGKTIDANLVLACNSCNMKKKGSLNEHMIATAFKHLLDVGESLAWVNGIVGDLINRYEEQPHNNIVSVVALALPPPIIHKQNRTSSAPKHWQRRLKRRLYGYARQLRVLQVRIDALQRDITESEEKTKLKIANDLELSPGKTSSTRFGGSLSEDMGESTRPL